MRAGRYWQRSGFESGAAEYELCRHSTDSEQNKIRSTVNRMGSIVAYYIACRGRYGER